MTKRNISLLLLLSVLALSAGCASTAVQPTPSPAPVVTPPPTPAPEPTPTPDPIAEQVAAMTAEEKVGQLMTVGFEGTTPGEDVTAYVRDYRVGGVILFKRNIESARQLVDLTNGLKALNGEGVPLFVSVDQEGGRVDRMPPEVHRTPSAYDITDPAAYGAVLAAECAAFGFNVDFAPVADIWSNPDNTVIGKRAFGTDKQTVADGASAAVTALQDRGIMAVIKHFPGHGDTDVDSHVGLPRVGLDLSQLRAREIFPFRAANHAGGVMVGHIVLDAWGEPPASLNPNVVTGMLRGEMGYTGVVFTDDMTMGAITQNYGLGEACVLAVEAGCDQLLVCHGRDNVDEARGALLEAVVSGRIGQDRLDESVYRILSLKAGFGMDSAAVEMPDLDELNEQIDELVSSIG